MVSLPAHLVATPVLERLTGERHGVVLGVSASAAWVDLDGFVVAITTREVPLLPNAVALAAGAGTVPAGAGTLAAGAGARARPEIASLAEPGALSRAGIVAGGPARFTPGRVDLGRLQVTWDPAAPPTWDPTVPTPDAPDPHAVAGRGAALLHALGMHHEPLPEAAPRPVDSRAKLPPGSATLPLRGPRQPGVGLSAAHGDPAPGTGFSAVHGDPEPGTGLPAAHGDPAPGTGLSAAHGDPESGVANPAALVRELARVGLATAAAPEGARGLTLVFQAVRERDPEPATAGARALLGRGPGLTPEGDDLLAAVAGTLAVLGPATGLDGSARDALLAALAPVPGRTTALSATLLALAAERRLAEPAGRLLDLTPTGETAWPAALSRLERLGHGSGRAYAAGIAATAALLAAGPGMEARAGRA
jgi:Protein of unknown function (DUF2877)